MPRCGRGVCDQSSSGFRTLGACVLRSRQRSTLRPSTLPRTARTTCVSPKRLSIGRTDARSQPRRCRARCSWKWVWRQAPPSPSDPGGYLFGAVDNRPSPVHDDADGHDASSSPATRDGQRADATIRPDGRHPRDGQARSDRRRSRPIVAGRHDPSRARFARVFGFCVTHEKGRLRCRNRPFHFQTARPYSASASAFALL